MELLSEMGGDGFEPSKSLTTDLQSAPFGHSGIHPYTCNADQSNDEHCYEQCRSRKLRLLDQVLRTITSNADLANFVCSIECFALLRAMPLSQTAFARSSASHYRYSYSAFNSKTSFQLKALYEYLHCSAKPIFGLEPKTC